MLIANGDKEYTNTAEGVGLEIRLILCEDNVDDEMINWEVEDLKFSVKQPVMGISYLSMCHCLSCMLCVMKILPCRLRQL